MSAMFGPSPLEQHAEKIYTAAKTISSYCTLNDRPHPCFGPDAPTMVIPPDAPLKVHKARQDILDSCKKTQQLVSEPCDYLPNLQPSYQTLAALRWLCRFHIFACIPLTGSVPYSEIASVSGVPVNQLRSVARMAMTSNLLCEPVPDQVAHNNVSSLFVTNPALADWAIVMTQFSMPAAASFVEATEKWGATAKKNETAVNVAMKTDLPLFDFVKQSPELTSQFAAYMKSVQSSQGTDIRHLVTGYDWAQLPAESVVVDVGGSTCSSSIALALAHPTLKFIVQDLPETVASSSAILAAQPRSVQDRIAVHAHNFFHPQPVRQAQVYLLRMILHDWPAAEATTILRNHIPVLKADSSARLLVMDTVLPVPGSISRVEEALLRVRDMTMIQSFNAKERELAEFVDLFGSAADEDGCLVLKKDLKPPGSVMSILEVAYEPWSFQVSVGNNMDGIGNVGPVDGFSDGVSPGSSRSSTTRLDGLTNGLQLDG